MADAKLLEVRDLQVEFKTRRGTALVLNGVDFELNAGETLCVVGESGCGKSMTALALLRLIPTPPGRIRSGKVRFNGEELLAASTRLTMKKKAAANDHHTVGSRAISLRDRLIMPPKLFIEGSTPTPTYDSTAS
jgi:ABC-type microcin C transport system duplicated ATPase subunit YejF